MTLVNPIPTKGFLLVRPIDGAKTSRGGIILPETAKQPYVFGEVVEKHADVDGVIQRGDTVAYVSKSFELAGFHLVNADMVIAVVSRP